MLPSKSNCDQLSDREIIRHALAQSDFFACLYERYEAALLRYIRRLTAVSEQEAADILQEAFIKIWRNLNACDPSLKCSSWIYRIVHNQAISAMRSRHTQGKDKRSAWVASELEAVPDAPAGLSAEEKEARDLLTQEILQQLPEEYREVLVLKFLEGLSYEEISDILRIPEGTVATRINRAKKTFRHLVSRSPNRDML